jgi:DNA-binding NarL/FixJ family response regulator
MSLDRSMTSVVSQTSIHCSRVDAKVSAGRDKVACPVILVDSDRLISTSLHLALRAAGVDAHRVTASDPVTLLAVASAFPPSVVVFELASPTLLDWCRTLPPARLVTPLRRQGKQVLLLAGEVDEAETAATIAAGASGTVPLSSSFESLIGALARLSAGQQIMTEAERRSWISLHIRCEDRKLQASKRLRRLSCREYEVLQLLSEGQRASAIAEQSSVSVATVRAQIRAILTKLDVNSQLQAVALLHEQCDRTTSSTGTTDTGALNTNHFRRGLRARHAVRGPSPPDTPDRR